MSALEMEGKWLTKIDLYLMSDKDRLVLDV